MQKSFLKRFTMKIYLNMLILVSFFVVLTSSKPDKNYNNEKYRPQFHFSPEKNLLKEPGCLFFKEGKYHLYYQYGPSLNKPDDLHWGHTVSNDLVHWEHLPVAILSAGKNGQNCPVSAGSIVIDKDNLLNLQEGGVKTIVAFYTGGDCGLQIAYSTDQGENWKGYGNNPIMEFEEKENAGSPKVFWHEESEKWVMLISRIPEEGMKIIGASIYNSDDLLNWKFMSHMPLLEGSPDLVKMQVDNRPNETKWVLFGGEGTYFIGSFDGKTFKAETPKLKNDYGKGFYGGRTWKDPHNNTERIIQMAWMKEGEFPGMPFNGQMNFPCEVLLKTFSDGIHLLRKPLQEIELLHGKQHSWKNKNIIPGINDNILKGIKGDCLHFICSFDIKSSDNFGIMIRHSKKEMGTEILYNVKREVLSCLGTIIPLKTNDKKLKLEILVDRSSIEIFANDGEKVISHCFTPKESAMGYEIFTNGGELFVDQMDIFEMNSIWRVEKKKISNPFKKGKKEK